MRRGEESNNLEVGSKFDMVVDKTVARDMDLAEMVERGSHAPGSVEEE